MRSKTFMSKINLQRGKLTVENRKSREKKTDMLEVTVKVWGNHVVSPEEEKETLQWERICRKGRF